MQDNDLMIEKCHNKASTLILPKNCLLIYRNRLKHAQNKLKRDPVGLKYKMS